MLDLKVLTNPVVEKLLRSKSLITLKFTEKPPDDFWADLNTMVLAKKEDLEIYLFRDKGEWKDLSFLSLLSNLKYLRINSNDVQSLVEIGKWSCSLKHLIINSINMVGIEPLVNLNKIESLYLGASTKAYSLKPLGSLKSLKNLSIEGEKKDVQEISSIGKSLKNLSLSHLELGYLEVLQKIENLNFLSLSEVIAFDFSSLKFIENLKILSLESIKGASYLVLEEAIASMRYLNILNLSNWNELKELPDFSNCSMLYRITLTNMTKLYNIDKVVTAPNLQEILIYEDIGLSLNSLQVLKRVRNLKLVIFDLEKNSNKEEKFKEFMEGSRIETSLYGGYELLPSPLIEK